MARIVNGTALPRGIDYQPAREGSMRRITTVLPAVCLAALTLLPATAAAQSQDVNDLRRRVEAVEREMFQQRLQTPVTPQGQSIERLQMRLDHLERELSAQRISDVADTVISQGAAATAAPAGSLAARVEQLEAGRAVDAKLIETLVARIEALEKAAIKK
jgi:hypothetical protein